MIACFIDAFSEVFELEASPVEGQSLLQKNKVKEKKKLLISCPKTTRAARLWFLHMPE